MDSEYFNIMSMVLVGYDFGVTTGAISAGFLPSKGFGTPSLHPNQYHQLIDSNRFSMLKYFPKCF